MFLGGTAPAVAVTKTASASTAALEDYNDRLGVG
jgi:hypothetical protein